MNLTLNRQIAPPTSVVSLPTLLAHAHKILSNGVELFVLHDPKQEVFRIDLTFEAGVYYQQQPLVAFATVNMLNEGTRKHASTEIAEVFDFYGAYVDFACGKHSSSIVLLSLNKYASETIGMLGEMATKSVFPEKELTVFLKNKKQSFLRDREKTAWLAQKEFARLFFGASHPYSEVLTEADYDNIDTEILKEFYKQYFHAENCKIILSGNITPTLLQTTETIFGALRRRESANIDLNLNIDVNLSGRKDTDNQPIVGHRVFAPSPFGTYHVHKSNAQQTSLRVGTTGVSILDKDYAAFLLLNTVLGGYFGSRLMSNIREEKGYTYGINSFNAIFPLSSYWCIAADVNSRFVEATTTEIIKEIKALQQTLIGAQEFSTVKNFLYGELLRELDGVFAQADALRNKLLYGLDNTFYASVIEQIKHISPQQIKELAIKQWDIEKMYIVSVG
ncbi:peptidase M16 [Bacteroidia bacterium]|nr:peptidase M16 [Bacteroidia bacterium]